MFDVRTPNNSQARLYMSTAWNYKWKNVVNGLLSSNIEIHTKFSNFSIFASDICADQLIVNLWMY